MLAASACKSFRMNENRRVLTNPPALYPSGHSAVSQQGLSFEFRSGIPAIQSSN
jgi:hypothetical protein